MVRHGQGNGKMSQKMEWTFETRSLLGTKGNMPVSIQPWQVETEQSRIVQCFSTPYFILIVFTALIQLSDQMSIPLENFEMKTLRTYQMEISQTCSFEKSSEKFTLPSKHSASPLWRFKKLRIRKVSHKRVDTCFEEGGRSKTRTSGKRDGIERKGRTTTGPWRSVKQ